MKNQSKTKKAKKPYSPVANMKCPRCGKVTKHSLYDMENGIYKCLICKTVHA